MRVSGASLLVAAAAAAAAAAGTAALVPDPPPAAGLASRREVFSRAFAAASAAAVLRIPDAAVAASADAAPAGIPFGATWSATTGLLKEKEAGFVSFDEKAYRAMRDDKSRTPLFKDALVERLNAGPKGPETMSVLDLGTGPYAVFAILAAEAGAGKVYAIEADKEVARVARQAVVRAGWQDVITVLDGFSTDLKELPGGDKVDVVVAEIIGSVASEEGAYATILDAGRFTKEPNDPASWIPSRIQTYASPASYTLHNLFGPPEFDWAKLEGEPVRFSCRDDGLQLLSDPVLVEDISFADLGGGTKAAAQLQKRTVDLTFTVDAARIESNESAFYENLVTGRLSKKEAADVASKAAHSLSGIALWPRLILDSKGSIVVDSRKFPGGGQQRSHWQTVLPICSPRPVGGLKGGETIEVTAEIDLPNEVTKAPNYRLNGKAFVA